MKKSLLAAGVWILLLTAAARAQEARPGGEERRQGQEQQQQLQRQDEAKPAADRKESRRDRWRGDDMVADNLDRVAATAGQILEVLSRDAGLMVELKRVIAEDAGASGQILEEADLTDTAITNRLQEDLRTRVLATRLLQRYGYLLPKLNPDSDLAQEHRLVLQERAQDLARAAERGYRPQAPAIEARASSEVPVPAERRTQPANPQPGREELTGPPSPQNPPRAPQDWGIETAGEDTFGTVLASSPLSNQGAQTSLSPMSRGANGISPPGAYTPVLPGRAMEGAAAGVEEPAMNGGAGRMATRESANRDRASGNREAPPTGLEPVRMVRRFVPYAQAPSLYDLYVQASPRGEKVERFGLEVFQHGTVNPNTLPMDLPVGPDYVLGPGDSLSIDLWGGVSQRLFRTVDREGKLVLPEAGPLLVAGKPLGEVQDAVQRVLRTQFRDVSADVSLLKLRTVRVYVVGEVAAPGAYDMSALSTPLNALFEAGGVTARGSLRRLEHYRGTQLVEVVDGYDLLLRGIRGDLQRLENGDSLRVPPLGATVTVDGMVRRPAVYELRGEKNLNDVLELAGGILPAAALEHIEVQRLLAHEKRTMLSLEIGEGSAQEASRQAFEKFSVQDGDEIHIFPMAPFNTAAVYLEGHVLRPGRYSYHEGMKVTELIGSYKDMLPEPSGSYAEIVRIQPPENRPVVQGFNLAAALEDPEKAPKLEPLDTVRIFGRYDLEAAPEFSVFGEVRNPGRYRSSGREHLRDAIYDAGGLAPDAWEDSAQLFRYMPDGSTRVFSISLRDALAGDPLNNLPIEPRDRILVHRQPERVNPPSVYVRGDVARPGRYPLADNMRVSDLIHAAGGLLRSANRESGDLTHYAVAAGAVPSGKPIESQGVNLDAALAGKEAGDLPLRDGDVLTVPQQAGWNNLGATVTIRGEVGKPGVYGIQPGERLSSLLRRAGGLLPSAYPQAAVFERTSVKEMQERSKQELIQRLEQESTVVKSAVTTSGSEEAALQQSAMLQRDRILEALRRAPVSGRLVVHIRAGQKDFKGSPDDIELRAGDNLEIPKQPGFVVIVGQVYNANAITYSPGKNAGWYLSRAGGVTGLANKKAIFIIRANGSVTSGGSGLWSGGVLSSAIDPGDTIVVPERSVLGSNVWKNVVAIAQVAQAGALAAAVAIP